MRRAASASIIICVVLRGGGGGGDSFFLNLMLHHDLKFLGEWVRVIPLWFIAGCGGLILLPSSCAISWGGWGRVIPLYVQHFLLQLPRCSWCYALLFLQELATHSWWWALCFLLELPTRSWCYPSNFLSELPAGSGCYARNFLLELWTRSYLKKTSQTIPSHRRCAKLNNIYNNFGFGLAATPGSKMHQEAKIRSCRSPCCPRCFGPTPTPRTAPATLHSPNQNWCPKVSTLPCWWFFSSPAQHPIFFKKSTCVCSWDLSQVRS